MEIILQVWRNNYEPARRHNSLFTNDIKSQNLSSTFKNVLSTSQLLTCSDKNFTDKICNRYATNKFWSHAWGITPAV